MIRPSILGGLCALWFATALPAASPNVLFISLDDLNDWIGCLGGHPQARTPHLDRFAASGVLFANAHCPGASCNPSRAAILSGLPPYRSGLYNNIQKMRKVMPDAELLPRHFARHGYRALGSGKILHYFIDARSWDEYYPAKETENPFPPHIPWGKRPKSLPRGGDWQYVETDWHAFDVSDEEFGGDYKVAEWVGDQLRREHDKPFFLACGIYRPHEPWFVPKKYFDLFPLESVTMPPGLKEGDLEDCPPAGQRLGPNRYLAHIREHGQWKRGVQAYLASIAYADAMVGRVLAALAEGPNADNTIVVLWSDHGWHLGEKEHWQKFTGWRVCTRVPLMVRAPEGTPGLEAGTTAGGLCQRAVNLQDLFPTLTSLAGVPGKEGVGGRSLVPLLADPNAAWPHPSITTFGGPAQYAISTEDWRYLHYRNGDEELYHVAKDPHEWTNLAADPAHAGQLAAMRKHAPVDPAPLVATGPDRPKGIPAVRLRWHAGVEEMPAGTDGGPPSWVVFVNRRDTPVTLSWRKKPGAHVGYGTVGPGQRRVLKTYAGHVWVVGEPEGAAMGWTKAVRKAAALVIE